MESALAWALAIIGTIGLTTFVNAVTWGRNLRRKQRFLRLTRGETADIVLVTSGYDVGGVKGVNYKRPVTSMGTLQAASYFSKTIGDLKLRKEVAVHVSQHLERKPHGDLILLGDPTKNQVAQEFLNDFNLAYPDLAITRPECEGGRELRIGDYVRRFAIELQAQSENPRTDIGLIVFWKNPFSIRRRRAIFCAGFTGWGTAAAAHYVLNDFQCHRYRELRKSRHLPRSRSQRWPCFVAVIEVTMAADKFLRFRELRVVTLPDEDAPSLLRAGAERIQKGPALRTDPSEGPDLPVPLEAVRPERITSASAR